MTSQKQISVGKKVFLKKYTTFQIGGPADYFAVIKKEKDLIEGINMAQKIGRPFFILGGGSNVLFPDRGYPGFVFKIEMKKIETKRGRIIAEAGAGLARILYFCLNRGLGGLEWTAGIPGTIGGAIRGNAGALGKSMKDSVVLVKAYNIEKKNIQSFKNKDCRFAYRESVFKKEKKYIILEAELELKEKNTFLINKEINSCLLQRKEKQPRGFSAGSVFKNYQIKNEKEKGKILKEHPEIGKAIKENIIPAAFLIDRCGLKGKAIGKAMISRVHANFIINLGRAKASDVENLIIFIRKEVKKKFGVVLEEEIIIVKP